MSDLDRSGGPQPELTQRLERAMNDHDLDALVGCFAEDYRNETPAHPARSFRGRAQVRRNWQQILGSLPDLRARLVRWAVNADTLWAEWDWSGTRPDGVPVILRGVTILGAGHGCAQWARFYMEPVEDDGVDATGAVRAQVGTS